MSGSRLAVRTPAKLNLGLEVLARRSDRFHEIRTVYQAVSIYDTMVLTPSEEFVYQSDASLDPGGDIARPVIERSARASGWTGLVRLQKTIPIAAGLGGGSSDAALALRIVAAASGRPADVAAATGIGADVPFLLTGGTAHASGIGEHLEQLPTPQLWFVVNVPQVAIDAKTRTLFEGLRADDFTTGERVAGVAAAIRSGSGSLPEPLPNAFQRQMLAFAPVRDAWNAVQDAAGRCALSGAGPALYSWHKDARSAQVVFHKIHAALPGATFLCRALPPHTDTLALIEFARQLAGGPGSRP